MALTYQSELTAIAEMMMSEADQFIVMVGTQLREVAERHSAWTGECHTGEHQYTDTLCEEFEKAHLTATMWLRTRLLKAWETEVSK